MDAILIEQVLSNLLENAIFHGKAVHVKLSVQKDGPYARFSVWNDGYHIPDKDLPTLFEGTLKHSESTDCDGKRSMGLGLSVCRAIVHAHGGNIEARNTEDGVEFAFRLPCSEEEQV